MISRFFGTKKAEKQPVSAYPEDVDKDERRLIESVKGYTMTSIERQVSLIRSIDYILKNNIPGDFVECGVWRGGSSMLVANKLKQNKIGDRDILLYDTFEGMPPPSDLDVDFKGVKASELLEKSVGNEDSVIWAYCNEESVEKNMVTTGYNRDRIKLIKGKVEETIPSEVPEQIALLRLDTDWYDSTYHELEHLYPLLSVGGILIIDDYGHWKGAKKAVDDYFSKRNISVFLNRIDMTGRLVVKYL